MTEGLLLLVFLLVSPSTSLEDSPQNCYYELEYDASKWLLMGQTSGILDAESLEVKVRGLPLACGYINPPKIRLRDVDPKIVDCNLPSLFIQPAISSNIHSRKVRVIQ